MIRRYAPEDMAALFSDEARFGAMFEVELLATEALANLGIVPQADAAQCRERAPKIDADFVADVDKREAITNHDTAAFVDIVQQAIGAPEGAWVHYGLTSSDVVDTALCWQLTKAADLLLEGSAELVSVLIRRAEELIDVPVVGRTHGMHAEPTTFGAKMALFALAAERDRVRLARAREAIAVGKLSGAVGTSSNMFVRRWACSLFRRHKSLRVIVTQSCSMPARVLEQRLSNCRLRFVTWRALKWAKSKKRSGLVKRVRRRCRISATPCSLSA